jgi:hypothetical protein
MILKGQPLAAAVGRVHTKTALQTAEDNVNRNSRSSATYDDGLKAYDAKQVKHMLKSSTVPNMPWSGLSYGPDNQHEFITGAAACEESF